MNIGNVWSVLKSYFDNDPTSKPKLKEGQQEKKSTTDTKNSRNNAVQNFFKTVSVNEKSPSKQTIGDFNFSDSPQFYEQFRIGIGTDRSLKSLIL